MSIGIKRTFLDRVTCRKLEDLVESHRSELENGKWTRQSFAEYASNQFKRPITFSHVAGALKTMKIEMRHGGGTGNGFKSNAQLRAGLRIVALEVKRCIGEMGCTVTEQFNLLCEELENDHAED